MIEVDQALSLVLQHVRVLTPALVPIMAMRWVWCWPRTW